MIRKQILLEPKQNVRLKALRARTGMSESELMRRALDSFDPEGQAATRDPEVANSDAPGVELLAALQRQNERTGAALERAAVELDLTLRVFAGEDIGEAGSL